MKRWDYRTCPNCGANLDVGERCDCEQQHDDGSGEGEEMNIKTIQREAARQGLTIREELLDGEKTWAIYNEAGRFIGQSNSKKLLYLHLLRRKETA